jgi:lipid II:glycine glycyltransferase (peptidoglycan interpeptide bridge formation enzyme)
MPVIALEAAHHPAYDAYVAQHPLANSYHQRAWWEVLGRAYGYCSASFISLDAAGQLNGALPLMRLHGRVKGRRLVSLPFSHAVPILAANPSVESELVQAAQTLAQAENYRFVEVRPRQTLQDSAFQPVALNYISELALDQPLDALFESFTSSNRRNIRKGEKSGFVIREGATSANLSAFYALEVATRHYQGAPVYPRHFFHWMAEALGDDVQVYVMALEGRDVAGMVLLGMGRTCIYGYGAWLRDESLKRLYPMNALIWHAITWAHQTGYAVFDFGTTPRHNEGLLEFKQRYNPTLSDLPYWYWSPTAQAAPVINRQGKAVQWVEAGLKRLPQALFTRLSPWLLREVG